MADLVIDASAVVDLVLNNAKGAALQPIVATHALHAPAHLDGEVMSALARLQRDGTLHEDDAAARLGRAAAAPIHRHVVTDMLLDAWSLQANMRVTDALYVALARRLGTRLVTTDSRLSRAVPDTALIV